METHRHAIIIGGREISCAARVKTWHEHGHEIKAGQGHNKRRRRDINLAVWHWTGGEGKPLTMAATLRRRKLGVEFAIDRLGVVWQFCDPLVVDTADAGRVNARSVGTEVICYGFRGPGQPVPKSGSNRPTYRCDFRGRNRRYAHFDMAQIAAALALADVLSARLPIPRRVPLYGADLGGGLMKRTMDAAELDTFQGHLGHFHVSNAKSDPGYDLLEALRVCWAEEL